MIQMGDSIAVERCLQNLNNVTIGTDGRLQLGFSKQAFLSDVTNPYILPDKTASFKDFTGSKNNRWLLSRNSSRFIFPSFFAAPSPLWRSFVSAWSSSVLGLAIFSRAIQPRIHMYILVVHTFIFCRRQSFPRHLITRFICEPARNKSISHDVIYYSFAFGASQHQYYKIRKMISLWIFVIVNTVRRSFVQ